eukprot:CAMPEP_0183296568 /NCGR_PEP_ID=MMETSP0160_2-20130417/4062_1 /TAXON_ID=2839 ORGANISM="Odontella Sinensis, Strain Grunow 1884" /NCGR_SAMPLE_ID=MMETSP0160_2 /ASSEMBLY_ACC=CAM_ASM_000250 /LENGTH=322 /DNA_ID=CAMNT_0025458191 /DNA_START=268 /DNA_END=1236 /DNA_ORIENTATION=+
MPGIGQTWLVATASLVLVCHVGSFTVLPNNPAQRSIAPPSRTELPSASLEPDVPSRIPSAAEVAIRDLFREFDDLYDRTTSIRCPFWRRRTADLVDSAAMVARFLLIRHKSLGILDPLWILDVPGGEGDGEDFVGGIASSAAALPPGCKAVGRHVETNEDGTVCKNRGLEVEAIAEAIRRDWFGGAGGDKGYYITGRLNSTIYTDDCLFDGPDPDMPVRGLRKYLSAASHLFDPKNSYAKLLSLDWEEGSGKFGSGVIVVRWSLGGTLMLPWRPAVKPWTGMTRYHLNDERLVCLHDESWDISVWEAFICTVWPGVGKRIWG